ncbi:hypothetical protein A2V80_00550 [Candidatus Woesebacteria bacterium RBG_16_39_8b]|uniref:Uncharacterized protein n=1 Tax=Candidatus Woesebacteria bacterium RBG_16_39_8b TaxID=1802482 RepID=A0A1F7X811_9BACT|nr:MAG: hypothetical protein A2V80_00550 [Candidatus Woesebacteria bacterium RBG_16_39_8b]
MDKNKKLKQKGFSTVGDILTSYISDEDKYISHEFQKYGYELAKELGDLKNKSLYIKLAKESPRGLIEAARNFVKDAYQVKSPPKLFMWKLSELKKVRKADTQEERRR